ncbi:MAG: zinc-finger domain-containing protein [Stappiaceae bacterium]
MAEAVVPHFHNSDGLEIIEIGSKEFMCIGARPPFDHPHVFLDMGDETEIVCPYCSTLYKHSASLSAGTSNPESSLWVETSSQAAE